MLERVEEVKEMLVVVDALSEWKIWIACRIGIDIYGDKNTDLIHSTVLFHFCLQPNKFGERKREGDFSSR